MVVIIYYYMGCKDKASKRYLNGEVVTVGQQYNVGEKPTVILITYINRHAERPSITKRKTLLYIVKRVVIKYSTIIVPSHHTKTGSWVNSKMWGRNPPLYRTNALIMEGHLNYTKRYEDKRHDNLGLQLTLLHCV